MPRNALTCCALGGWLLGHCAVVLWVAARASRHCTVAAAAGAPLLSYVLRLWTQLVALEGILLTLLVGCIDRVGVVNTCAWAPVRLGSQHGPCCARVLQVDLPATVLHCAVLASVSGIMRSWHVDLQALMPLVGLGRRRVLRVEGLFSCVPALLLCLQVGLAGCTRRAAAHPGTGACVRCAPCCPNTMFGSSALVQSSLG